MNAAAAAFVATRELGLHVYGHLLGIWCEAVNAKTCEATMANAAHCLDERGLPAIGALATLGDMAMQTALLATYPGQRLATRNITVRRFVTEPCSDIHATARALCSLAKYAAAETLFSGDSGAPLAHATATFVPVRPPRGWQPLPWELGKGRPTSRETESSLNLSADERAASDALQRVLERADVRYADLLGLGDKGLAGESCRWPLQEHLLNRAKEAQGGAIFGALAERSRRLAPDSAVTREHTTIYFRPAMTDLTIDARIVRAGRRFVATTASAVDEEGELVATAWSEFTVE